MNTVSREDYLRTKVSLLPFVIDGQLLEMTLTTDVLLREMSAVVADHPPAKLGLAPERARADSRLGLTDQQVDDAMAAIERDDAVALKSIFDTRLKEAPELRDVLFSSVQTGRLGHVRMARFAKRSHLALFRY